MAPKPEELTTARPDSQEAESMDGKKIVISGMSVLYPQSHNIKDLSNILYNKSPVLFEETSALIPNNAVLVEVSPHGLLQAILKRSLPDGCHYVPLTRREHKDNAMFLLEAIGKLYMEGYNPKVKALYPTVEFPVSTGTPMLSHLTEWDHSEKWNLSMLVSERRKTAAACTYIISTHDDEHAYLKGHAVRGKTVYPFAAALISVWDTLAMTLDKPRKEQSVKFNDVHFYSEPVLHDQTQLRLSVTLHRGTGKFESLQLMVSDGIAKGYVKPLSRVIYAPSDVSKSFKLMAESKHRGRVLLRLEDNQQAAEQRIVCSPNKKHLVVCNEENLGLQLAERLIFRGARNLHLHVSLPVFWTSFWIYVSKNGNKIWL